MESKEACAFLGGSADVCRISPYMIGFWGFPLSLPFGSALSCSIASTALPGAALGGPAVPAHLSAGTLSFRAGILDWLVLWTWSSYSNAR